jgi:hypothetical protein
MADLILKERHFKGKLHSGHLPTGQGHEGILPSNGAGWKILEAALEHLDGSVDAKRVAEDAQQVALQALVEKVSVNIVQAASALERLRARREAAASEPSPPRRHRSPSSTASPRMGSSLRSASGSPVASAHLITATADEDNSVAAAALLGKVCGLDSGPMTRAGGQHVVMQAIVDDHASGVRCAEAESAAVAMFEPPALHKANEEIFRQANEEIRRLWSAVEELGAESAILLSQRAERSERDLAEAEVAAAAREAKMLSVAREEAGRRTRKEAEEEAGLRRKEEADEARRKREAAEAARLRQEIEQARRLAEEEQMREAESSWRQAALDKAQVRDRVDSEAAAQENPIVLFSCSFPEGCLFPNSCGALSVMLSITLALALD